MSVKKLLFGGGFAVAAVLIVRGLNNKAKRKSLDGAINDAIDDNQGIF